MTFSAGARLGPYEILSPLGAGGMGEVYRARDTRLGREVALKVLSAELSGNPERLRRFEQEARAASALNHPNIVVVYDVGRNESASYIAMELVGGKNLRDLMGPGPLSIRRILPLATQIAEGLARAHAAGIVHRDLKPENVMVSEEGFVKIVDFGLAKLALPSADKLTAARTATIETPRTEAGVILGTVGYMSPEQAVGREVDFRSDQFSLGSILYEMATGRRAFQGESMPQTLSAIIEGEPSSVTSLRPDVPQPLIWIIERCLAKAASERYESTRDLARDLANLRDRLSGAAPSQAEGGVGSAPAARARPLLRAAIAALVGAAIAAGVIAGLGLLHRSRSVPPSFQQLTFRAGTITSARFAPDGETIVYSAIWEGLPPELFLVRRGSTESRALGLPAARVLSISRSGEMAILLGREVAFTGTGTLARVPLSGGAPREVLGAVLDADWTPDDQLVATTTEKDHSRLWFPLGHQIYESAEGIWALRVSPKGDRVACLEGAFRATGDVVVLDRSGRKRTLSRGWRDLWGLAWSPDGEEVWFTGTRGDGYPAMYGVSLSGRERVLLRVPQAIVLADAFHDRSVLLLTDVSKGGIACLSPGETQERQLGWLDFSVLESLSSDARTMLFTERRMGGKPFGAVYLRRTDGSPAVRLGEGCAEGLSPDGKWALVTKDYEQWTLLPTGAGSARDLPRGGTVTKLFEGDWLDARRIVFSGFVGKRPLRIYLQDIGGGDPRPLTPEGVSISQNGAVTPDGKFVLAVSEKGWFLYPTDGGAPRAVPGLGFGEGPVGWSASGETVYVRREEDGPTAEITALEIATGRRRPWKTLSLSDPSGVVRIFPIVVAPDEKSYCYSYDRMQSTLHLVEGLP
ncbi:MAG: protein kinase [Acidobacteriota bacterium]